MTTPDRENKGAREEALRVKTREYLVACNMAYFQEVTGRFNGLESGLVEWALQTEGLHIPNLQPGRWDRLKPRDDDTNRSDITPRIMPPKGSSNEDRIQLLGEELLKSTERPTLVSVGSGFGMIDDQTAFGKNIILVDPVYSRGVNPRHPNVTRGYKFVPENFTPQTLAELPGTNLAVDLNFVVHHFDDYWQTLKAIFENPKVKGVTVADYALIKSITSPIFFLRELFNLFPSYAEAEELLEVGFAKFHQLHTKEILTDIIGHGIRNNFRLAQTTHYPKMDSSFDDMEWLEEDEIALFKKGTKFAATFVKR
jgi:hypothetical protein